jgi:hypothetical protein
MSDCIEKIKNNEYNGFTRKLFLEGKSNEILCIQIKDFEDDKKDEPKRQILRKSEMTQIQMAAQLDIPDMLTPVMHDTDPPRDLAHQFMMA